jgi:hypothetical protein
VQLAAMGLQVLGGTCVDPEHAIAQLGGHPTILANLLTPHFEYRNRRAEPHLGLKRPIRVAGKRSPLLEEDRS